jgi:hypothetical protein
MRKAPTGVEALNGDGADDRNRTDDLRITNALLYQLSYVGSKGEIIAKFMAVSRGLAAPIE